MATALPFITAGIQAAALGYQVHSGEQSAQAGRRSLRRQDAAQSAAKSAAIRQESLNAMARRRANQGQPDVASLLEQERLAATGGAASTILTDPSRLRRGQSLLGAG